jgi:hypothetical protein
MSARLTPFAVLSTVLLTACGGGATSSTGTPAVPAADVAAAERLISADETIETLTFPAAGGTRVSGTIDGYGSPAYLVPVAEGQTLRVVLESPSSNAYFNVHDAADSSGAAVFNGNFGERTARLTAPRDMTYVIRPFQPRASARRGERIPYSFDIQRR